MSGAYTSDGRRISSMTHAKRGHQCAICPEYVFGNGGVVSHGRAHPEQSPWRAFFPVGDPRIDEMIAKGADRVEA